jgi:hypothetical protein
VSTAFAWCMAGGQCMCSRRRACRPDSRPSINDWPPLSIQGLSFANHCESRGSLWLVPICVGASPSSVIRALHVRSPRNRNLPDPTVPWSVGVLLLLPRRAKCTIKTMPTMRPTMSAAHTLMQIQGFRCSSPGSTAAQHEDDAQSALSLCDCRMQAVWLRKTQRTLQRAQQAMQRSTRGQRPGMRTCTMPRSN